MNDKTVNIVKDLFLEYYKRKMIKYSIDNIDMREFGFQLFNEEGMIRHKSFKDYKELHKFIIMNVPKHIYYSTAIYANPASPTMDTKDWLGAELVFDIDADHLDTECKYNHDYWVCTNCEYMEFGPAPQKCPRCGSSSLRKFTWVCSRCLEEAKNETLKLIEEFLVKDLGVNVNDIEVYFSGHRGFHIHVKDKRFIKLDSQQRREIVDYVKGIGLNPKDGLMFISRSKQRIYGPELYDYSWRGRVAKFFYEILLKEDEDKIKDIFGHKSKRVMTLKEKILTDLSKHPANWAKILNYLDDIQEVFTKITTIIGCNVDEKVTIDIHRLIRMPGSLHGKTGIPAIKVPLSKLEAFELDETLSPFTGVARIRFTESIPKSIMLMNTKVRIVKNTTLTIELPIALYLTCKGLAEIEEIKK